MKLNETTDPIYVNLDRETEHVFNNFIKELNDNVLNRPKVSRTDVGPHIDEDEEESEETTEESTETSESN